MSNDLGQLRYVPQNFRDLAETELGKELWSFLKHRDNLIRMETATLLDRAAVEPLAAGLVAEFGEEVSDDRVKQMIGHMVRQVMAAMGYETDRSALRITRPSLFTSGTTYRPAGSGPREAMKITKEQRDAWIKNTKNSAFNTWLNKQVRDENGVLLLEQLYAVARKYGIEKRYDNLNPGQQRMNIGVQLRKLVDPKEYEST
ncbi:hypothetical protein EN852_001665 [Mesorhizobium sp. M2E.F.Ca.ET.209.01.1.1]|uniref:hypothetical protein n=1 Tax=Mesorhizobium sp. M2E.F.Ca.ET.209.01.1.1 TaxID=2500526 RepID=UPI000FDC2DDD|nr:hypothetical protein [Mesorhizobium sp. M2E.F.Ca.ET.209.01.1.1]TGS19057.1 hypothetical protein EN852_001665 [Mesorhizobium sp. M2E.F.Ca.ET.209.01.1.1]